MGGGEFWLHHLGTIPRKPYKRLVILDGDMKASIEGHIHSGRVEREEGYRTSIETLQVIEEAHLTGVATDNPLYPESDPAQLLATVDAALTE